MSVAVRRGIASLDSLLVATRIGAPAAGSVLVAWDRKHLSGAVVGLLDDDGVVLDVSPELLQRLTGTLARPLVVGALELAFPNVELASQVILTFPVDEPAWARALDWVASRVSAGFRVSTSSIGDSVWAVLESAGLPSGSVMLARVSVFVESYDDLIFEPTFLCEYQGGAGTRLDWVSAKARFPAPEVVPPMLVLLNELGVRREREMLAGRGEQLVLDLVTDL
jgi:hypothetical protein